jgi:hypothetical protein
MLGLNEALALFKVSSSSTVALDGTGNASAEESIEHLIFGLLRALSGLDKALLLFI